MSRPTSLLLVGLCLATPLLSNARGEPMTLVSTEPPPLECPRVKKVFVVGRGNTLCRPVSSVWSVFYLPEGVSAAIPNAPLPPGYIIKHEAGSGYVSVIVTDAAIAQEASFKIERPREFTATVIVRPMSHSSQSLGEYVVEHLTHEQANDIAEAQAIAAARAEAKARTEAERLEAALTKAQKMAFALSQQKDTLVATLARIRTSAHVRGFRQSKRIRELDGALTAATTTIERLLQEKQETEEALAVAEEKRKGDIARVTKEAARRAREVEANRSMERMRTNQSKHTRFIPHRKADTLDPAHPWTLEILGAEWNRAGNRVLMNTVATTKNGQAFHPTHARISMRDGELRAVEMFGTDENAEENKPGYWPLSVDFSSTTDRPHMIAEIRLLDAHGRSVRYVASSWSKQVYWTEQEAETARDAWLAEEREKRARKARAEQLIIGPHVSYGACWLGDGFGNDQLEATGCTTVGVRVTKGITEMFAFETELSGAWTGEATFEGVMVDGQLGDLTRSATLGRVALAGLIRFGDKTIPYARLGIGVQGLSSDSQFATDGSTMDRPNSSVDIGTFFKLGGGIQRRVGEQWIAGAHIAVSQSIGELTHRSLDGGAYFAYGWNPGKER